MSISFKQQEKEVTKGSAKNMCAAQLHVQKDIDELNLPKICKTDCQSK